MTQEEEYTFIVNIQKVISKNPHLLNRAIKACTNGSELALSKMSKQAMDMETIAVAMHSTMDSRYKKSTQEWIDRLVASKISKHLDSGWTDSLSSLIK